MRYFTNKHTNKYNLHAFHGSGGIRKKPGLEKQTMLSKGFVSKTVALSSIAQNLKYQLGSEQETEPPADSICFSDTKLRSRFRIYKLMIKDNIY